MIERIIGRRLSPGSFDSHVTLVNETAARSPLPAQEEVMGYRIAGIDVHKRMLAVVVADVEVEEEYQFERHPFGTTSQQLRSLAEWLMEREVEQAVIAYASHCTSLGRCETFSINRSLLANLTPLAFLGGSDPGSS